MRDRRIAPPSDESSIPGRGCVGLLLRPAERIERIARGRRELGRVGPSGTVAFLFTDIEGSTQRWDQHGEAMKFAVRRHDALMRAAIDAHAGFVFKTIGDAFCAAFWRATDAIAAAVAAQTALAREDFSAVDGVRVRMAIHSGTADERDGDYFGPTVNRVARLLSIGHGGQILLSKITVELAQDSIDTSALRDMGEHWLKDLHEPERVYQIVTPGGPTEFPALRSLGVLHHNLPRDVTSFVGREADVAEIVASLARGRLVTLVGAGGVGKTRCALKAGTELLEAYADGVWFVDLAALSDPELVASEVAAVFRLVESTKRPVLETLATHLRAKQTLILLDNCEHLIDACCRLTTELLRACPSVSILTTSREALKVNGERVYHLPTLGVPERGTDVSVAHALSYSAVALFVARAVAADSRFALTPENAPSVAEICRRLDGIPLALELAAARVKVLAPRQLERKLDERFRILTGGGRTALPRQQTMRALIDWSYDLLDAGERELFATLSIFVGSFSLESAMAVGVSAEVEDYDVLDRLTSLADKSLVVTEAGEHDVRYRLLESMRQYGRERLAAGGGLRAAAGRHAVAYTELAERLENEYGQTVYRVWVAAAERETENIRAALTWTFGPDGDPTLGARLAVTLRRLFNTSYPAEARRWVQTALARAGPDSPPGMLARLELADAHLASTLNAFNASLAAARRALVGFTAAGDQRGIANAQRWAGRSLIFLGQIAEGEALMRRALATYASLGFRQIGGLLRDLGLARAASGDVSGARELFARALEQFVADQNEGDVAITAGTLAEAEFGAGDPEAAIRHAEEALAASNQLNDIINVWIRSNLAAFLIALDRFDQARVRIAEALRTARQIQSELDITVLLQHLAATLALDAPSDPAAHMERSRIAARLTGFIDKQMREIDFAREFTELQEYERMRRRLDATLGTDTCAALIAEGAGLTAERALELAAAADDDDAKVLSPA